MTKEERTAALFEAVRNNSIETLIQLLNPIDDEPINIDQILDHENRTLLIVACSLNHLDIAELLIDLGTDANLVVADCLPLLTACENKNWLLAESLIKKMNAITTLIHLEKFKDTLLDIAFDESQTFIFSFLLNQNLLKVEDYNIRFKQACQSGYTDIVDLLIEKATQDGNLKELLNDINHQPEPNESPRYTALMHACNYYFFEGTKIITTLLKAGADINVCDDIDGFTAFMLLCAQPEDMREVEPYGGEPYERDILTVIDHFLVSIGEKIYAVNNEGDTALILAAKSWYPSIVEKLIAFCPDPNFINHANEKGQTALMLAIKYSELESIRMLIAAKADLNICDRKNQESLTIALRSDRAVRFEIIKLLLEAGAYVEAEVKNKIEEALEGTNITQTLRAEINNLLTPAKNIEELSGLDKRVRKNCGQAKENTSSSSSSSSALSLGAGGPTLFSGASSSSSEATPSFGKRTREKAELDDTSSSESEAPPQKQHRSDLSLG